MDNQAIILEESPDEIIQDIVVQSRGEHKRTLRGETKQYEEESQVSDEQYHIFEHFRVSHETWCPRLRIQRCGLIYLHRNTNWPLAIVRCISPETRLCNGYDVHAQFYDLKTGELSVTTYDLFIENINVPRCDGVLFCLNLIDHQYSAQGRFAGGGADKLLDSFMETLGWREEQPERKKIQVRKRVQLEPTPQEPTVMSHPCEVLSCKNCRNLCKQKVFCSLCHYVYCSRGCLKQDRARHKTMCKNMK
jgi:hypothetical protein